MATAEDARPPLTAARVIEGAIALADRIGTQPLTIRKLASELDTKPMSLYHHVAGKEAILDGMVDAVFADIDLPPEDLPWKEAIRVRCVSARDVLGRHHWAVPLMESRTAPGPATLRHHDAVLGCFRRAGFSLALTAHAYAIVDSFVYGFALQEATLPFDDDGAGVEEIAGPILEGMSAEEHPHFVEMTAQHFLQPGYSFGSSFVVGLGLVLDGIERLACAERGADPT